MSTSSRRNRRAKAGVMALGAATVVASLVTVLPTAPAQAIELPGISEIIDSAIKINEAVELCKANKEAGLPCMQSTATTVTQIYTALNQFVKKYDADRVSTKDAFNVVIANQKDAQVRDYWSQVRADLETTQVGMTIYTSYVDCAANALESAAGDASATCKKTNRFGQDEGTQPATMAAVDQAKNLLIENGKLDPDTGIGGYRLTPTDLLQRIGGSSTDPRSGDGLLNAMVDREQTAEVARNGWNPSMPLQFYRADVVNRIGQLTSGITQQEGAYFAVRVAAASAGGNPSLANDLAGLADRGRVGNSPVLSLAQQQTAYTFPGWSAQNQLAKNQAYYVPQKASTDLPGAVLLTNEGASRAKPVSTKGLPTEKRVAGLADAMASDCNPDKSDCMNYGRYAKVAEQGALPKAPSQVNGSPAATGRLWTAPQKTWKGQVRLTSTGGAHNGNAITTFSDGKVWDYMTVSLTVRGSQPPVNNYVSGGTTQQESVPVAVYDQPYCPVQNGTLGNVVITGNRGVNSDWRTTCSPKRAQATFETLRIGSRTAGDGQMLAIGAVEASNVTVADVSSTGLATVLSADK